MDLIKNGDGVVFGVILLAVAVAVLALRDRARGKKTDWRLVASLFVYIPLTLFAVKAGWLKPDTMSLAVWLIGGAAVAITVGGFVIVPLVAFFAAWRKAGYCRIRSIQFLRQRGDKQIGRCERCSSDVEIRPVSSGGVAYQCEHCGKESHWK